jgi:hypothetical protein
VYKKILQGNWRDYTAWEMGAMFKDLTKPEVADIQGSRVTANQNMYDGPGSVSHADNIHKLTLKCGVFRAFQGWTSLSSTGPSEGTLRVYPLLRDMTAYVILRPLFR